VPSEGAEGGGGREPFKSGGNTGAESGAGGFSAAAAPFVVVCSAAFLFSASLASRADWTSLSPTFARSSSIRFFAFSLSGEPGCWRITSL
jgi:hypothetical protein